MGLPAGPEVDFCPTQAQAEAHLAQYGFDDKPTVPCGVDGQVVPAGEIPVGAEIDVPLSPAVVKARDDAFLRTLMPLPDSDGDPSTIEGLTPEGGEAAIFVQTTDPERFRGMTPRQFADEMAN